MAQPVDRLFVHCKELLTLADGPARGLRRREALGRVGLITDGALAVAGGRIVAVGTTAEIGAGYRGHDDVDLSGFVVLPGLVDAHTHPVFVDAADGRSDWRNGPAVGRAALDVVRGVRAATVEQLAEATRAHLDLFVAHGTTAVEAKSGYGLQAAAEQKSLRALNLALRDAPLTVHRTFLPAHVLCADLLGDRDDYLRSIVTEMLPALRGLCDSCDVHLEPGGFGPEHAREILSVARVHGLRVRMLADAEPLGGAELGVELGADVVAGLAGISVLGLERLAAAPSAAVLLPAAGLGPARCEAAPARTLIDHGCGIALGTDFHPLGCAVPSMLVVMALARLWLRMSPEECVAAATINGAAALGFDDRLGSLHPGKRCDLVALDLPSYRALGDVLQGGPVPLAVVAGEPVAVHVREQTL